MKGGFGDGFFTIDHLLVTHAYIQKFQNRSPFPSGRKVITLEEEERKLTDENNGHLSFPVTRFRNQRSCQNADQFKFIVGSIWKGEPKKCLKYFILSSGST